MKDKLNKPYLRSLILVLLTCLAISPAEIQQKFSINMPEKLAVIYERKISLNTNIDNIVTENITVNAEILAADVQYKVQISDEISAINGEISAKILPSELTRVPLYNEASPTATVIGYATAHTPITIIRLENGFAKIEVTPETACWIQNRYVLSDTVQKQFQDKQELIKRNLEESLGLKRILSVERRPWATAEYLSLGTGLGFCVLGLSSLSNKQESPYRPAAQSLGLVELVSGSLFIYNSYQSLQKPDTTYIYVKQIAPTENNIVSENISTEVTL